MKQNLNKRERKEAIALSYDEKTDIAPRVVAKGKGIVAERILEKARENQVPIEEDPTLLELLWNININEAIPEELYQVVAEIFAFIYKTDRQSGTKGK